LLSLHGRCDYSSVVSEIADRIGRLSAYVIGVCKMCLGIAFRRESLRAADLWTFDSSGVRTT
jgi:hypothetical protein